jgi:heptosyltransferase I
VTHVVPLVRTLRQAWPETAITWVIGTGEFKLLEGLPGVEFLVYDKRSGFGGMLALRRALAARKFDALLQMQVAMRANLLVGVHSGRASHRLRPVAFEGPARLFVNERIADRPGIHVLDAIGSFCEPAGHRAERSGLEHAGARVGARVGTCAMAGRWDADAGRLAVFEPCVAQLARRALRGARRLRGVEGLALRVVRRAQCAGAFGRRCDPRGDAHRPRWTWSARTR